MDPIQLKLFLEALKKGDTKKATEQLTERIPATEYERGYRRALEGMIASIDNNEVNSLFVKMVSHAVTKKNLEEQRRKSRKTAQEPFRPVSERGYEKAWYDILSIFLGKKKVGLERLVEGELY
ncbi:MAG: hypothetical protein HXS46_11350 [Theionarchaea archaeon]|nr:MAG: hypothetical protein AYK18_06565 [Theionarchaea archaeon DG-70]MBU7011276.1 hypothetical protein [Theionarchaea archaeon]